MKKGKLTIGALAVCILLSVLAAPGLRAEEVIELKAATWLPTSHPVYQQVFIPWGQLIEKRSNGRVKFAWFPDGSLVKAEQHLSAIKGGMVDVLTPMALWTVDKQFPITSAIFMPFQVDNETHASLSFYGAFQQMPEIREELKGIKMVGFSSSGMGNFHMKGFLVKTAADFKGKRIWPANSIGVESCKLWGAIPTLVKVSDIYMSLQRGTLDGIFFPTPPLSDFRFTDLINNHTLCGYSLAAQPVTMNQARWDSLPSDIQKIFEELTLPLSIAIGNKFEEMNEHIVRELKKRGDNIYMFSPSEKEEWRASIQPIFDTQAAAITATGRDGKGVMNRIQNIVAEARKKPCKVNQDWQVVK